MASALHMRTNPATASSPWTRPAAATAMQSDLMQSDLNAGLLQLLNQLAGLQAPQQIPQLQTVAAAVAAQQAPLPPPHFFAPPAAPALAALPGLRLGMGLGASSSIAQPAAGATASGTSSDRLPLGGDATTELEAANSVAGLKVRSSAGGCGGGGVLRADAHSAGTAGLCHGEGLAVVVCCEPHAAMYALRPAALTCVPATSHLLPLLNNHPTAPPPQLCLRSCP